MQNKKTEINVLFYGKVTGLVLDRMFDKKVDERAERWVQLEIVTNEDVMFYVKCRFSKEQWGTASSLVNTNWYDRNVRVYAGIVDASHNKHICAIASKIVALKDDKITNEFVMYNSNVSIEDEDLSSLFDDVGVDEEKEEN